LLSLRLIFLILSSACEFDAEESIVTYTFFELAPLGIEITTAESVQDIYPDINLRMYFDAELLKTEEMTIETIRRYSDEPSELNEHLISITNEHNIIEWEFEGVNDGFTFKGVGYE